MMGNRSSGRRGPPGPPRGPPRGPPAPPSHTQSLSWVAPGRSTAQSQHQERERLRRRVAQLDREAREINRDLARFQRAIQQVAPHSPIVPIDFDRQEHRALFAMDEATIARTIADRNARIARERAEQDLPANPPPILPPFDERLPEDSLSTVLAQRTIFTPNLQAIPRELAPWPEQHEQKYEGDDRIATDMIHGRFLPHPRVSGNVTVNWQQRLMIPQFPLENFHYPPPDENEILLRANYIPALEIEDDEGKELIGEELMDMLDE